MKMTRNSLPIGSEEMKAMNDLLAEHEETRARQQKMIDEMVDIGIDLDHIESSSADQMLELSKRMFGKK